MIVKEMRDADCFRVIGTQSIARLATSAKDQPYVVPVQYVFFGRFIYSFSMPGRKVENMRGNPLVCLQIDELLDLRHWKSVVIEGKFHELSGSQERQQAWEILEHRSNSWWEPGALKPQPSQTMVEGSPHLFFTVSIDRMSGRETAES